MERPEELKKNEPLMWSAGTGAEVWDMFCAAIAGDLETIQRLVKRNASLVRCHYSYRTPLYFAVRENQIDVARFLLEHGTDPLALAVNDSLLCIARDRGYGEMEKLLENSPQGNAIAAAIRERNPESVFWLFQGPSSPDQSGVVSWIPEGTCVTVSPQWRLHVTEQTGGGEPVLKASAINDQFSGDSPLDLAIEHPEGGRIIITEGQPDWWEGGGPVGCASN